MKITTGNSNVVVKSLGRLFKKGNKKTHIVKIVKASDKSDVGSVSIAMNGGGTDGQFKYQNLATAITLEANTSYYIVSEETSGADQWYDLDTSVIPSAATIINGSVSNTSGSVWTEGTTPNKSFGPLDFTYDKGTTPDSLGVNLKGKIDFNNVGLMGHSRGGEGVRAAYNIYNPTNSVWKDTASRIRNNVNVKGIFEIAPTDGNISPSLIARDTAWAVVLGACDGDVFNLQGLKAFDRTIYPSLPPSSTPVYPAETKPGIKATYYVYGANHNFFNSQWQQSEPNAKCLGSNNNSLFDVPEPTGGGGYGSLNQQNTASSSFLAFFRGNVGNTANPTFNQNFNPLNDLPSTVSGVTTIERGYILSSSSSTSTAINDLTYQNTDYSSDICSKINISCRGTSSGGFAVSVDYIQPGRFITPAGNVIIADHDDGLLTANVTWDSPSPNRYLQANSGSNINATSYQTLDFRVSRRRNDDPASKILPNSYNTLPTTNFSIQLVMGDGRLSRPVNLKDFINLSGPVGTDNATSEQRGILHPILQTVRIPLSKFADADLTQVKGVRFIFNDTRKGAIYLSAVRLSK